MPSLGLETSVVDASVRANSVKRFREQNILLPTFAELANPESIPRERRRLAAEAPLDRPDPRNLHRVHWHNNARGEFVEVPEHIVLTREFTGVDAPIVVLLGNRFPMIRAHKVLAAYGCLAPRVLTGEFDPTVHRAVWPSTGNYCRGGVAISRIMGCRGVAVLPEGMSRERFNWLDKWVVEPGDIIRTPGSESNVKEIYDACAELSRDPHNIIFNQFAEFGNHLVHYAVTGRALERVAETLPKGVRPAAYVSATGSAGTLAAGDYLKEATGARIVAVEALECPTLLYNGFGEHNIQGIGDKHIPLIHNVMNTDVVVAVSDQATDGLDYLLQTSAGRMYLTDWRIPPTQLHAMDAFGYSGLANVLAAIKTAKYFGYGPEDAILTVATDDAAMYKAEREAYGKRHFPKDFEDKHAAKLYGQYLAGAATDHVLETTQRDRERMFNLGYFTWVEQQGLSVEDFSARKRQSYWKGLRANLAAWDALIREFNAETGVRLE